jgi:hypothetical protein
MTVFEPSIYARKSAPKWLFLIFDFGTYPSLTLNRKKNFNVKGGYKTAGFSGITKKKFFGLESAFEKSFPFRKYHPILSNSRKISENIPK